MNNQPRPVWPLLIMIACYAPALLLSGAAALLGLMFGTEVYRSSAIPFADLASTFGPLVVVTLCLGLSIIVWRKGMPLAAYAITAAILAGTIYLVFVSETLI
jgi:hypothetical protein